MKAQKLLVGAVLLLASLVGVAAFLYPFFFPAQGQSAAAGMMAHGSDAPLLLVALLLLCLVAVFSALTAEQMTSKMVALLGVLTALAAALRALPGPAGFNAVFLLPILAGYCYGPTFGFLLGSLALLVSALIGGGVGPWLPYQMLTTGWVGLLSGFLPDLGRRRALEPVMLAVWGAFLGLLFGAIMNLWFWPFLAGPVAGQGSNAASAALVSSSAAAGAGETWRPGMALWPTVRSYMVFYVATSLWWDLGRAAGNAALLLFLGRPILRVLRRFRARFRFDVVPVVETGVSPTAQPGAMLE